MTDELSKLRQWLVANEDLWRCVSGSPVDVAILVMNQLRRQLAEAEKEIAALHSPASRDFTPAEILRIASELGLCNDDVKHQPTFGKIAAAVSRLSAKYGEVLGQLTTAQQQRDRAVEALRRIESAANPDDPDSYRCDDREGCLDTVHSIARETLAALAEPGEGGE